MRLNKNGNRNKFLLFRFEYNIEIKNNGKAIVVKHNAFTEN